MTNDAAVACDFYERLYGMTFRLFLDANGEPDDDNGIELRLAATVGEKALFETSDHSTLVPATTVAELRAECVRIERENREGWKQAAHHRQRADAAERRVAELEKALRGVVTSIDESGDPQWKGSPVEKQARAALTKESP